MQFDEMNLVEPLLRAISREGYTIPTPIQAQAIPYVLEGKDLLGCAQTGTGKTAAFALPILQRLHLGTSQAKPSPVVDPATESKTKRRKGNNSRPIRALVITPTRELAAQIGESFTAYGFHTPLRNTVIYGGVKQSRQVKALRQGVDILVATPGRLLDLMNQREVNLSKVEIIVLDEADNMLDMGFIHDIRKVITNLPKERQALLFSATMPGAIRALADTILTDPVSVKVASENAAADTVIQTLFFVQKENKPAMLEYILGNREVTKALIFSRTKHGADKITKALNKAGFTADAIHSNKSQNVRTRTLKDFKTDKINVLVASDIAARGLDVDDISHVINFDMPSEPETYVHRIGRTGRAGSTGKAVSFCSSDQRDLLYGVEKLLGKAIPVTDHELAYCPADIPVGSKRKRPKRKASGQASAGRSRSAGSDRRRASGGGRAQAAAGDKPTSPKTGYSKPKAAGGKPTSPQENRGKPKAAGGEKPKTPQTGYSKPKAAGGAKPKSPKTGYSKAKAAGGAKPKTPQAGYSKPKTAGGAKPKSAGGNTNATDGVASGGSQAAGSRPKSRKPRPGADAGQTGGNSRRNRRRRP